MNQTTEPAPFHPPQINHFYILDIDSTLVTTHQRNQAVLDHFIAEYSEKYPNECQTLKAAQCQPGDYGLRTALERISFQPQSANFSDVLNSFWRIHFFSNNFLVHDLPTPGAVEWTIQLAKSPAEFVFLTARPHQTMYEGSLSSLIQLGFPVSKNNLFLKDDTSISDDEFKARALKKILPKEKDITVWFIDNEPVVLNSIDQNFPHINLVFFDSVHSGKMQPPSRAHRIDSFLF